MRSGDYPFQIIDYKGDNKISLFVDTTLKPTNFISTKEQYYRNSLRLDIYKDSLNLISIDSMDKADKKRQRKLKRQIEIHSETNSRTYVARFSNLTIHDTILFPIQDASLIGILEARDSLANWIPIQFWPISGCGNSYYSEKLLPGKTITCTVNNDFGDYKTTLRLKIHGTDTIYTSNRFYGSINYSMFIKPEYPIRGFGHILCDSVFYLEHSRYGDLNIDDEVEIYEFIEE